MSGISANGMILKFATTATPTPVVTEVTGVGFDPGKLTLIDVTAHGASQESKVNSGIRGLPTLPFDINYKPGDTVHEALRAAHAAQTLCYLTLILPDAGAAQYDLTGHVTSFEIPKSAPKDSLKREVVFEATTGETFTQ